MNLLTKERPQRLPLVSLSLALLGLVLAVAAACGGGGESPTGSPAATSGPGKITVRASEIKGQSGRVLLVLASPQAGGGGVGRACIGITSGSFSAPSTVLTDVPASQDACGESTPTTNFPEGTYTVTAGIYAPPAQKAEVETKKTVRVSGDVAIEIDGASLSR